MTALRQSRRLLGGAGRLLAGACRPVGGTRCPFGCAGLLLALFACRSPDAVGSARAPAAPDGLDARAIAARQVTLHWNEPAASGIEVWRALGTTPGYLKLARIDAGIGSLGDIGLLPSTTYCYQVRAFAAVASDTAYSRFSAAACATTFDAAGPSPAANLRVAAIGSRLVSLAWLQGSDDETGFLLERSSAAAGPWMPADTMTKDVLALTLSVVPEQPVCFRVIAFDPRGMAEPSNVDCATPPAAPTDLTAAPERFWMVLGWGSSSTTATAFEIERAAGGSGEFQIIGTVAGSARSFHDAGAVVGVTYAYRVRARRGDDISDYAAEAAATMR